MPVLNPNAPPPIDATPTSALGQPAGYDPFSARYWVGRYDLRPMALLRFFYGIFLFYNVCDMLPDSVAWFSDRGAFPRPPFIRDWAREARFSFVDSLGWPPLLYIFMIFTGLVMLAFALGYRTRLMSILTFVTMASIQERNPSLFDSSDSVIRLVSLWMIFIPSGNVWSVDALLARRRGITLPKEGCALFVRLVQLQINWIYLCTGLHKMPGEAWRNGDALHYCFHWTHAFARPWVTLIADNSFIIAFGTWATLVIEHSYLLLCHFPSVTLVKFFSKPGDGRMEKAIWVNKAARVAGMTGVALLHIGIAATIIVGLFSYLMPLVQLAFFEPDWSQWVWDRVKRFVGPERWEGYKRLASRLPYPSEPFWGTLVSDDFVRTVERVGILGVVAFFCLCIWYSAPPYVLDAMHISQPSTWATTTVEALDAWSAWNMFAPDPPEEDYHLTGPAEFEDGSHGNIFGGAADGPGDVRTFWYSRWEKYFDNFSTRPGSLEREWAFYQCRKHNQLRPPHQPRLYTFTLFQDLQRIPPIGQPYPPVERATIWDHRCFDKPSNKRPEPPPAEDD